MNKGNLFPHLTSPHLLIFLSNLTITVQVVSVANLDEASLTKETAVSVSDILPK